MDVMDAIKERRSIRKYKPDPVPEKILLTLFEALRWVRSWFNTQCWQVVVVKDSRMKHALTETLPKQNPARSSMSEAPLILVFCATKGISGFDKGQPSTVKGDWLMFDTGLAVQNLCLTAHALGLGTVVVGRFDHQKVANLLDVPQHGEVVAMVLLGYPAAEGKIPKRKHISEFTYYNTYPKSKRKE